MQWSFPNKASSFPRLLSFKGPQEEKPKTGFDSLASTGLVTITTSDSFDAGQKSALVQKNGMHEKQGESNYNRASYLAQHLTSRSVASSHKVRVPIIDVEKRQPVSLTLNMPLNQSFFSSAGKDLIGSVNPQPSGGLPTTSANPLHRSNGSVVGTTNLRNTSKPVCSPAQLTIFYAGSVCVYDNVSPEKAEAIMLLAGNGPSLTPKNPAEIQPSSDILATKPKPAIVESFVLNQSHSIIPSPVSVTSCSISQLFKGTSGGANNTSAMKQAGNSASSPICVEPLKAVSSSESINQISSAVPQARKASLARFLERRKERLTSVSPYASNKFPDRSKHGIW